MKKGDLTIRYLVLIALAIVVLIIVGIIFHQGMADFVSRMKGIFEHVWSMKPPEIAPS